MLPVVYHMSLLQRLAGSAVFDSIEHLNLPPHKHEEASCDYLILSYAEIDVNELVTVHHVPRKQLVFIF